MRRLAATTVQAEKLEARMVNGDFKMPLHPCFDHGPASQRLDLERRSRNVTPSVGQYLASTTARAPSDDSDAEGTMILRVSPRKALTDPNLLGIAVSGDIGGHGGHRRLR